MADKVEVNVNVKVGALRSESLKRCPDCGRQGKNVVTTMGSSGVYRCSHCDVNWTVPNRHGL